MSFSSSRKLPELFILWDESQARLGGCLPSLRLNQAALLSPRTSSLKASFHPLHFLLVSSPSENRISSSRKPFNFISIFSPPSCLVFVLFFFPSFVLFFLPVFVSLQFIVPIPFLLSSLHFVFFSCFDYVVTFYREVSTLWLHFVILSFAGSFLCIVVFFAFFRPSRLFSFWKDNTFNVIFRGHCHFRILYHLYNVFVIFAIFIIRSTFEFVVLLISFIIYVYFLKPVLLIIFLVFIDFAVFIILSQFCHLIVFVLFIIWFWLQLLSFI